MRKAFIICLICIVAFSVIACSKRQEEYSSPNGENTIIVEYDYVSRPSVIYNGEVIGTGIPILIIHGWGISKITMKGAKK